MDSQHIISSFLILLFLHSARSDDTSDQLLKGINTYRASLHLPTLSVNDNAACLAEQLAKQFKGQPCTNTTGSDTVPGTEDQFPNYPSFLDHCHLNATVTQDAAVMPACVPNLDPSLVLTNFTKSQYSASLNGSQFVGAGIADEGDWVVVVMSTNTTTGSFDNAISFGSGINAELLYQLMVLVLGFLLVQGN